MLSPENTCHIQIIWESGDLEKQNNEKSLDPTDFIKHAW